MIFSSSSVAILMTGLRVETTLSSSTSFGGMRTVPISMPLAVSTITCIAVSSSKSSGSK